MTSGRTPFFALSRDALVQAAPPNSVQQQANFAKQLRANSSMLSPVESIQNIVAQHPMAQRLSPAQLAVLVECATCSSFHKGQLIFSEGDSAQNFYLIQSGKVALESNLGHVLAQIDVIEAGSVLGWAWMFPPYYWHFDARAIEPTRVISFYGKRLREECERDIALGYEMASYMAELVIKRLQKTRVHLLQLPKTPRIFSALVPN